MSLENAKNFFINKINKQIKINEMKTIKELKQYLNDFDNLIDTGHFPKDSVKDFTFHHKDLDLREFVLKGRNFIAETLTYLENKHNK